MSSAVGSMIQPQVYAQDHLAVLTTCLSYYLVRITSLIRSMSVVGFKSPLSYRTVSPRQTALEADLEVPDYIRGKGRRYICELVSKSFVTS